MSRGSRSGSTSSPRAASPSWVVTLLIAASALLGLGGLAVMITYETWVTTVIVIVGAVALVVALARRWTRSRWIPTAMGAVAGLLFMTWAYAAGDEGSRQYLPTPGAIGNLIDAVSAGILHAELSTIPVVATPGFAALITAAVLVLFLIAEHLASSWGLTATAGILLILAWLPAAILQHQVSITVLVLAIGCWVAALVLTRRPRSKDHPSGMVSAVVTTAAVIGVAVLVAPIAVGAPGWGAIPRFDVPGGIDGSTRLNLALDLRNSLTTRSSTTVLVYGSSGARPDTLRLYSLADFDGNSWSRDDAPRDAVPADAGVLWPTGVDNWDGRERDRLDIQVRSLSERNLPVPSAPRTVDLDGEWLYVPDLDEVTSDVATTKDLTYSLVTDLEYHEEEGLVAAQEDIDDGADTSVDPQYLAIAPAIDEERIGGIATEVTERATNRYEQALALQQYLRSTLEFRYDTTVSPSGDDSVSEFLDSQRGYCVQFASTMVVMARSLGIPARLSVGFLGGEATDDGSYVVRGSDAHAWPELYFADQGWVRFEPTPAVQTGAPPSYTDTSTAISDFTGSIPGDVNPAERDDITNPQTEQPGSMNDDSGTAPAVGWWAVAALTLLALLVSAALWWRRHTRPARTVPVTERAWQVLSTRLASSVGWPDTLTPLEARDYIDDSLRPYDASLSAESVESLARITTAVTSSRYRKVDSDSSPETHANADQGLIDDARAVATEVEQATKKRTAIPRR